jgi:hypothetical protein
VIIKMSIMIFCASSLLFTNISDCYNDTAVSFHSFLPSVYLAHRLTRSLLEDFAETIERPKTPCS